MISDSTRIRIDSGSDLQPASGHMPVRRALRVDLWPKCIHHSRTMPPLQKLVGKMRSYEPRPAGDENKLP